MNIMENTTLVGKDGYPVVTTTGEGHNNDSHFLAELIHTNSIAENSRAVLNAITQGTYAATEATNRTSVAGIKETSEASRDNLRETARVGSDLAGAVADTRSALERANGESRLSTAIAAGEIRELIGKTASDNLVASKDVLSAVYLEGCKTRETILTDGGRTREKAAEQFAALQLEAAKNFSATQLKACEDKHELSKQIAECCCEAKVAACATNALIIAQTSERRADELADVRMQLALSKSGK